MLDEKHVYLPHITEMVTQRKPVSSLSALFIQIGRWQYYLLALVASGFIIFGRQFIQLWAGAGFEDAYWITILIILPFTIDLIQNIGLAILQAMNHYDFRAKIYFITGVLNLALAIPMGIKFGGIGCAFATGVSMLVGNGFVMNWFYNKYIGLDIPGFWKQIWKITITIVFTLVIGYEAHSIFGASNKLIFGLEILLYTGFYGISIYCFAMTSDERMKIKHTIGNLTRNRG